MRHSAKLYRATLTALLMMAASAGVAAADLSDDAKLNEELNALRTKLISLWNPPAAVSTHPGTVCRHHSHQARPRSPARRSA